MSWTPVVAARWRRNVCRSTRGDTATLSPSARRARRSTRMILVQDAVAEINRAAQEAEIQTMARLFADVQTTDEVVAMLASATTAGG
jgi:hypothetical protein